ncbi:hypothetical protein DB35_00950 [Streptomyces abyssalis]|uniref:DUF5667 domain-containing protein n=1 Tax=Streptomyces abyssalis TaxID=933944 RepID=A0A1E7JF65_9ACTN|nr:DUF5667 domain-containing protein [Streptomyces abyssalis]OEU85109.1 hypothetical protein AN215_20890 [Streptomyces abyssalis]OEU95532.1 hypothetical protein DB35_00950 [Streptomyces abyssalis]
MIGSATASKRAAAFAQALDEHELDEAAAADRTAEDGRSGAAPPTPVSPCATAGGGPGAAAAAPAESPSQEEGDTEPALLLGLAERLRSVPRPAVAPDVKIVQRAQLIAAMEAEFASPEARARQVPAQRDGRGAKAKGAHRAPAVRPLSRLRPNSRLGKGIAASGLGVGVAASALGGVASASSEALPGDSLYGLKRGMEDLRLDFADDETDRGRLHLARAATRLQEARRLMEQTRGGAELDHESVGKVRRALAGMRNDAGEGHHLLSTAYKRDGSIAPMRSLSSFRSEHRESWAKLQRNLPPELFDVREEVSSVFDAMDSDITPIAGLIADSGKESPRGHERGGEGRHGQGSKSPRPSHSSDSAEADGREDDRSGEPSPSDSDSHAGELIGGGGLLDPSGDPHGNPSLPGSGGSGHSKPESDVTLPPIVPDVLPGLKRLSDDR